MTWRTPEKAFYRPHLSRHAWNLFANGFYTKGLDSEDFDFLERVRRHGCANGGEPRGDTTLIDELEFWHFPYVIDPAVVRRGGPLPKRQKETVQKRTSIWHMRRAVTEQDKLIAAAELERERIEWGYAELRRKWGAAVSDAEWEAAKPRKLTFGAVVNQHYVPQWKLDELGFDQAFEEAAEEDAARAAELEALRQEQEAAEQRAKEELARQVEHQKALAAEAARRLAAYQAEVSRRAEEERKRAEEHRNWQLAEQARHGQHPVDLEPIKRVIRTMVRSGPFNIDMLMNATGKSRQSLQAALDEMVRDRELRVHGARF